MYWKNLLTSFLIFRNDTQIALIESSADGDHVWLLNQYPKLQSLAILTDSCDVYPDFYCHQLTYHADTFFKNNPTVKDVSCIGTEMTKAVLINVSNIDRLSIHIRKNENLNNILGDLKLYCEKNPIKCLEFAVPIQQSKEYLGEICGFNKDHPVHGMNIFLWELKYSLLQVLDLRYLRKINLTTPTWKTDQFPKLLNHLEHLEELKWGTLGSSEGERMKTFLIPFVHVGVKLKKLTVEITEKMKTKRNDLIELNAIRSRMIGACFLKIHFLKCNTYSSRFKPAIGKFVEPEFNIPMNPVMTIKFTER